MAELHAADHQFEYIGRLFDLTAEDPRYEPPAGPLVYYRLGPEPQFPLTELFYEGHSDELSVDARLWPPHAPEPGLRKGPPWMAGVWIDVTCDVGDAACTGHPVAEWVGEAVDDPLRVARDLHTAVDWAASLLTGESVQALRARDKRRGHAVVPRRREHEQDPA